MDKSLKAAILYLSFLPAIGAPAQMQVLPGVFNPPVTPPSSGITRVNEMTAAITIASPNTVSLGFTVASGDLLSCGIYVEGIFGTISNPTANGTSMTTLVATFSDSAVQTEAAFFLPNAGGKTSVVWTTSGLTDSTSRVVCVEYAGVSTTASVVNTAVTGYTGAVTTNTWTNGVYTATSGDLCMAFAGATYVPDGSQTWAATSPFGTTSTGGTTKMWTTDTNGAQMMMEDILGSASGSVTAAGTYSEGFNGTRYMYSTACVK